MGGLWKLDQLLACFSELLGSPTRRVGQRRLFFRDQFVEPVSLELPEAVANWPPADIVDRGHLVRPTPFVTVIGKPRLLSFDLHIDTVSTSLPMAETPYQIFSRVLCGLDHTRLRLLGLLTDTLSSADIVTLLGASDLYCVSDGSHDPRTGRASHAWVMTNSAGLYRTSGNLGKYDYAHNS